MGPLLQITTLPMIYELSIERARLEISQDPIRAEIQTVPGQWEKKQEISKVRLDTFEFRKSIGLKSVRGSNEELAQIGKKAAMQATAEKAEFGNQLLHIEKGANIPDTAFSQYFRRATEGNLVFVPVSPTDISWSEGMLQMNYTPASVNMNWNRPKAQVEFVPGSITMNIVQYPSIQIEYLGEPIYVPPSANPNYEASA